jgi:hypothetical protein
MRRLLRPLAPILLVFLSGCAMAAVAAYKIAGPPDEPAKFVPAKVPTLVMVENYRHQSAVNAQAERLARQLADDLEAHKVAPLIPIDKLQELRDAKPKEFPTMTIAQIAHELGAEQVIYVELRSADVTPMSGGVGFMGEATATVKLVDGIHGETIWPSEQSEGYPVVAATKVGSTNYPTPADVRNVLYAQMTDQISKLFHKWKPEYEGSEKWTPESTK